MKRKKKARACRYCGCTDGAACRGGCRWVTGDVCSRCAIIFQTGQLQAISTVIAMIEQDNLSSLELLEGLRVDAVALAENIAQLTGLPIPDAFTPGDGGDIPVEYVDEAIRQVGKGVRSSDLMEAAGGAS